MNGGERSCGARMRKGGGEDRFLKGVWCRNGREQWVEEKSQTEVRLCGCCFTLTMLRKEDGVLKTTCWQGLH